MSKMRNSIYFAARFTLFLALALVLLLRPAASLAQSATASFVGEFWETSSHSSVNTAITEASGPPDATFRSRRIDYPQGSARVTSASLPLRTFLGSDASSISGDANAPLTTSLIKFSGYVELTPGPHTFEVASDDGFRLLVDGNLIMHHAYVRSFNVSRTRRDVGSGTVPFELYFFERNGSTGVEFSIDGMLAMPANPASAEIAASKTVSVHREDSLGCENIPGSPDVAAAAAIPGSCMEYRIEVDNTGTGMAHDVTVEDQLDPNLIFRAASHSGFIVSDPGFAFETPSPATDCGATTCRIAIRDAAVAPGGQGTITIRSSIK